MNSPDDYSSAPVATAQDRRHHPRYTVQVQIEIRKEGSDVPMRLATTDLSRGGCYIQMLIPLSVGNHVQATLWLDEYPLVIRGLVVTCHPQFGNGIMFVDFEGHGEQLLKRYLDAVAS